MSRVWDRFITDRDRKVFERSGYGARAQPGSYPAVLVIDMRYSFVGDRPKPILDSVRDYGNSCGEEGWNAVLRTAELLASARQHNVPVIYSVLPERRADGLDSGKWRVKNTRALESQSISSKGTAIVAEIAPFANDHLISKQKPSMFFGTPLVSLLNDLRVDTLVVAGLVTSGCVRASVVDAFSYNYAVLVVEDCCGDRWESSHAMALFEMNAKYADVVGLDEATRYLASVKP